MSARKKDEAEFVEAELDPSIAPESLALDVRELAPEDVVHRLITHAAKLGASDLFFCTNEDSVSVLVRHLGTIRPVTRLTADGGRRALAHIKANSGMDVAEKRRPLDGRWVMAREDGPDLDIRISTLPTLHGEDFTLRLLDRQTRLIALDKLGLFRRDYNQLLSMLGNPGGLILVTGPTGSGKTTTLYACLHHLNDGQRKLNTIEDPVEYQLIGVRQSQVNPRIDLNFADLLRSTLRQAPDVIMIGEVRDAETAQVAVRAANSGHLVLATLHAPVAAGAVPSMLNLGVHPHFLASSLLGVLAQRLVRVLCDKCKAGFDLDAAPHTFDEVRKHLGPDEGKKLYGPVGCAACRRIGFSGRTGVFEMLSVSPGVRRLIMERATSQTIRQKAIDEGMVEFRHSALLKVAQGQTTIEEVFRSIPTEYLGFD
jgi:type II secretory ATPase GspE/PulE/Tfp pilus assembly ATPase PilB-like protein